MATIGLLLNFIILVYIPIEYELCTGKTLGWRPRPLLKESPHEAFHRIRCCLDELGLSTDRRKRWRSWSPGCLALETGAASGKNQGARRWSDGQSGPAGGGPQMGPCERKVLDTDHAECAGFGRGLHIRRRRPRL